MKLKLILIALIAALVTSAIAVAGSVAITPSSPTTDDALTCTVSGSTATYNFYWFEDGARYSKITGKSATVPSSATNGGELWTCKAYMPSSGYLPETYVGEASVTITIDIPAETRAQCDDWIDNDGDGLVDMDDPGCENPQDNDEYNAPEPAKQCADGLDNDGDGLIDMNDPGCTSPSDNDEYNAPPQPTFQCSDGLDNDGDGLIDMNDPGCIAPYDNDEYNAPPQPTFQCSDSIDNDGDGLIDMNDPGCTSPSDNDEYNAPPQPTFQCSDGLDNDGDGLIDMNDPGCTSTTDNDEYNTPEEPALCIIEKVWINDNLQTDTRFEVELGQTLDIDMQLKCNIDEKKEIRVVGSIWSGEYEDIQDDTGLFIVKPGITYIKGITLKMPEVMNTDNNKLRLKVIDGQNADKKDYNLYIKEKRHNIAIQDIITNQAEAGKSLFIKVRMENLGYKAEEDVRVDAEFLGVTARTYVDNLEPFKDEEDTDTAELRLVVPEDAETGNHELKITVSYGNEKTTGLKTISVKGIATIASTDDKTIVSITELPKEITTGKEWSVKIMLVNLNTETKAYGINIDAPWAKIVEHEQLVTAEAGKAVETVITLIPQERGKQDLTLTITANDEEIASQTQTTEVHWPTRLYAAVIGGIALVIMAIGLAATVKSVQRKKAGEISYY